MCKHSLYVDKFTDCSICLFSWYELLIMVGGVGCVGGDQSDPEGVTINRTGPHRATPDRTKPHRTTPCPYQAGND